MVHPMMVYTEEGVNNITVKEERLQKLLVKPKPILWNRGGVYYWVPIEKVRNAVRWFESDRSNVYPPMDSIVFVLGDTVAIPKEAGDVIWKYNGHSDD